MAAGGTHERLAGLRWKAERLRSMPPAEIPHRGREWALARLSASPRFAPHARLATRRPERPLAGWLLAAGQDPSTRRSWADSAARLAAGKVDLLGTPSVLGDPPDWRRDPVTGGMWPDGPSVAIDYRHGQRGLGDVKYIWELHRLQFLVPAACHAAVEGDTECAELVRRVALDWLAANPAGRGVGWTSMIELAIRLVSLLAVEELLAEVGPEPAAWTTALQRGIATHVAWLARFPSLYSSANNHRVAELTGVFLAASLYPGLLRPARMAQVRRELVTRCAELLLADGAPAEQSSTYGRYTVEWLALAALVADAVSAPLPDSLTTRVRTAAGVLGLLTDSAGTLLGFGDDDGSRVLSAALPLPLSDRAVRALAGDDPQATPAAGLRVLPTGGLVVARDRLPGGGEALWALDCGPLGHGHIAAHAHADTLAVWLNVDGRPLLAEAGTFGYHAAGAWRDRLRSTRVHNTVVLGGQDSSAVSGPFNWRAGKRAAGRLLGSGQSADGATWWVQADHDGYTDAAPLPAGTLISRRLARIGPATYRIDDDVRSPLPVEASWALLLAPDLVPTREDCGWSIRRDGAEVAALVLSAPHGPHPLTLSQVRGEPDGRGWYSGQFGDLEPAWQLRADTWLGGGAGPLTATLTLACGRN